MVQHYGLHHARHQKACELRMTWRERELLLDFFHMQILEEACSNRGSRITSQIGQATPERPRISAAAWQEPCLQAFSMDSRL
eukprot:scaffold246174_cov17-Tisochrysis_lutea.AAC.1